MINSVSGSATIARTSISNSLADNGALSVANPISINSPAYVVSLTKDDTTMVNSAEKHTYSVNQHSTQVVDWQVIMSFADGQRERALHDSFMWNFINNPHIFLMQGTNTDSRTARQLVAEALIQAM